MWRDYGLDLEANLRDLHGRVHRGAYRARPSRRAYIPKPDGRLRPLGVATLEDKIVQRAVVEVLNAIYEEDFLGFSYGFRPGRSPHDALDALAVGINRRKVNWVLDADIREYFSRLDWSWLEKFLEHRIAGQEGPAPDPEMSQSRGHRGRGVVGDGGGNGARGIGIAVARERLPALRVRPVGPPMETRRARGEVIIVRFADDYIGASSVVTTPSNSWLIFAAGWRGSAWSWRPRRRG
jgi:RNA-directed DNA polymerase